MLALVESACFHSDVDFGLDLTWRPTVARKLKLSRTVKDLRLVERLGLECEVGGGEWVH